MLVHFRIVPLFFASKFKTALVTGQDSAAGAQLSCLPDEMSAAEPLLSSLEFREEALLRAIRSEDDSATAGSSVLAALILRYPDRLKWSIL